MDYEGRICRPPMERASFMLPIMTGCSYNACKFCNLFNGIESRILPVEQVKKELLRVKNLGGNLTSVFLGDGNAFGLSTDYLLYILELIHIFFPNCNKINMDATVNSILEKSDKELQDLKNAGIRYLYLGIESGLDDVLEFMKKGHTVKQAETAIERLHKAGYKFGAHIMTGIAGRNRGCENAKSLAKFFNKTKPARIINFSLFLHKEVPLYKEILSGHFLPADELENLEEEKYLIELLKSDTNFTIEYEGLHDFLEFRLTGVLPKDKKKMLETCEKKITQCKKLPPIYAFVEGECTKDLKKANSNEKVWTC